MVTADEYRRAAVQLAAARLPVEGTALVRLPAPEAGTWPPTLPSRGGTVAWGTRVQFDGDPVTYRALPETAEVLVPGGPDGMGEIQRVRSVRLVPIRPDRNDPDVYPQPQAPRQRTGMSRKARKAARQRARNWAARS